MSQAAHKGECWLHKELYPFAETNPGCFLDLGANIGGISLALAACGWKGYAIEASKKNCEYFKKSIMLNNFDITLCEKGVWKSTGIIYFLQNGPWGCVFEQPGPGVEPIDVICLDDYKQTELSLMSHLDFIKMDIEGSEVAALQGMGKFLNAFDYPPIFAEANAIALNNTNQHTVCDMIRLASEYGYEAFRYYNEAWHRIDDTFFIDYLCTDYMFIHNTAVSRFPGKLGEDCHKMGDEERVAWISEKLEMFLSDMQNQSYLEWAVGICATLKDFKNYRNDMRINKLVSQIHALPNKDMTLTASLSWME